MAGMSKVTAEQLEQVRAWAAQGTDLNGIQKLLASECGVHLTYMDVRFLLLDNGIEIAAAPEPAKPQQPAQKEESPAPEEPAESPVPAPGGKPAISLDEIQIPGAVLSGKVVFPSGTKGSWLIDNMGRFGWSDLSGKPTPEELQAFQFELTQLLRKA